MKAKVSSIGGQALMEGVMMRGKSAMAMAVRDNNGIIQIESERLKPQKWYNKVPLIRGVAAFISSLVTGISTITRSAKVLDDEQEELSGGAMGVAVFLGVLFAIVLFIVLPEVAARLFDRYVYSNVLLKSAIAGVLRLIIFILYLVIVSRVKDIKRTFMYHGAEHRTINCYESGMELTVENIQKCSTRHNRCGTTFLFIVMVVSIIVFTFINWALKVILGGVIQSGILETIVFLAIKLLFLPLVAGISYEVLKGLAKLPDNLFAKILRAPGLALQALTTSIPDDSMAEVALRSFLTVLKMDNDPNIPTQKFGYAEINDVRAYIKKTLPSSEPIEAEWIMCETLKVKRTQLNSVEKMSIDDFKRVKSICSRRLNGEPLDYITNHSEFYGYDVYVDTSVLIPRMETEILVSEAIKFIGDRECEVLDLCTGSGCIALALAHNTHAHITASDISDKALAVADKNLASTSVQLVKSDLFGQFSYCSFDVIVSNPPYIRSNELPMLSPEVNMEPRIALDGGYDGLEYYKKIVSAASNYLKNDGILLLEIGYDQAESVSRLMTVCGFDNIKVIKDLDGNDRVIEGKLR